MLSPRSRNLIATCSFVTVFAYNITNPNEPELKGPIFVYLALKGFEADSAAIGSLLSGDVL